MILLSIVTEAGELPTELRLFAFGENATSKGTITFSEQSAESVMAAFAEHGVDRLPIDADHGMLKPGGPPEQHIALGWFVPEVREDGLYASEIEWTERGAEMVRRKEYRYVSPAIYHDGNGEITKLINLAVTNLPATQGAQPLAASAIGDTMSESKIRELLSLSNDADVIAPVKALVDEKAAFLAAFGAETVEAALSAYHGVKAELASVKAAQAKAERAQKIAALNLTPAQAEFAAGLTDDQLSKFVELSAGSVAKLQEPVRQPEADNKATLESEYKRDKRLGVFSGTFDDYVADRELIDANYNRKIGESK